MGFGTFDRAAPEVHMRMPKQEYVSLDARELHMRVPKEAALRGGRTMSERCVGCLWREKAAFVCKERQCAGRESA